MDDLFPDDMDIDEILRQYDECSALGLESISIATTLSDFLIAAIVRTAKNIKNTVTGDKTYPLSEFELSHRSQMASILSGKNILLKKNILPCPVGMLSTYVKTGKVIQDVVTASQYSSVIETLVRTQNAVVRSDRIALVEIHSALTKQPDPITLRDTLMSMYHTNGLAYQPAEKLFSGAPDIKVTYDYVMSFHKVIDDLSKMANVISRFTKAKPKTDLEKDVYALVNQIMRHIAGVCGFLYKVLEKIMGYEHNYVRCLTDFYQQLKRA